jgi:hypothetical protein
VDLIASQLVDAGSNPLALANLIGLDSIEMDFVSILLADKAGVLAQHPYVVRGVAKMLRQRWAHLALGAGQFFVGLMALPDDALPFGVVATNDLDVGEYISTRYPLRYWGDLRVFQNIGGSHIQRGVVWMSHDTATALGGDFDGDYFQFASVEDYPHMAEVIRSWVDRPEVEIIKVKTRRASPFTELDRVMIEQSGNLVGKIALLIARAVATGRLDLVPRLAQELQISVDRFKYDLENDQEYLDLVHEELPTPAWVQDRKRQDAFLNRRMQVDSTDAVGMMVRRANALWQPLDVLSRPLVEYAPLVAEPADEQVIAQARTLNQRFGKLISQADGKAESLDRLFVALKEWASQVENPTEWARALWHMVHTDRSSGVGSLPFIAFPAEIVGMIGEAPVTEQVTIVGLGFNTWASRLQEVEGEQTVKFALRPLGGHLRTAAIINGDVLGFVSKETPVFQHVAMWQVSLMGKTAIAVRA